MRKSFALTLSSVAFVMAGVAWAEDAPPPTDPQIAQIAVVANTIDIDAGKLAGEKAQDAGAKELAAMMVRDHTAVNEKAAALVKKLGVTPEESDTSKTLKENGDKELEKLRKLSGPQFDKEYVDNEVAYHQAVIDVVSKTLIPNTKNPELKKLLEDAAPIFKAHLEHAKMVQAGLKK